MQSLLDRIEIRSLTPADNPVIASVIRETLAEFGANHPGTVYFDPTTDQLFELFQTSGSFYQVAVLDGKIVGGGGYYPSEGLPEGVCELVKMYLLPNVRGIGLGSQLIRNCLEQAVSYGYRQMYIETMPELKNALRTYERFGFRYLDSPMGNTGHFGCDLWMLKDL
jgi:putative acetyltransferase